jgi:hypothetical protein
MDTDHHHLHTLSWISLYHLQGTHPLVQTPGVKVSCFAFPVAMILPGFLQQFLQIKNFCLKAGKGFAIVSMLVFMLGYNLYSNHA